MRALVMEAKMLLYEAQRRNSNDARADTTNGGPSAME
jgi:hypothetical protein